MDKASRLSVFLSRREGNIIRARFFFKRGSGNFMARTCRAFLFNLQGPTLISWGHSSVGRAPAVQAGGQGFDPPCLHQTRGMRAERPDQLSLTTVRVHGRSVFIPMMHMSALHLENCIEKRQDKEKKKEVLHKQSTKQKLGIDLSRKREVRLSAKAQGIVLKSKS